ncbi:MAG: cupin domain-containing protein, partial [Chloroflexota bacterium]
PETNISVGIWEATQGEFEMTYPFNEGMTILQGRVTITSAQGEERTLEAGDSLFAERGEKATWHIQGKRRNTGKNSSTSLMMSALMKWRHTPENFSFHLI